jgi:Zn-dependent protease/predicted transcriptional regulator
MDSGLHIGRILGIPIRLHPTWFLVFLLVVLQLWGHLASQYPSIAPAWRIAIALVTSGLLFGSVLMHELGHSIVALHYGVAVRSITLFIFGGVAWMDQEPDSPRAELRIALAGPAVNFALAPLFFGLAGLFGLGEPGMAIFRWLGALNLGVALFNLLPGFPLDGGRVLRALLWARGREPAQATRMAARIGQAIAYGLVGMGAAVAFADLASGLWLAFIGWFILTASVAYRRQASFEISLRGLVARDVMTPHVPTVEAGLSVARFAKEHLLRGERWAIVLSGGAPRGLVSRTDVKGLDPERWESTRIEEIATPIEEVATAGPEQPVTEVMHLLSGRRTNQIPIVEGGRILGAVTLQNLVQAIEIRTPPPLQADGGTPAARGRVL